MHSEVSQNQLVFTTAAAARVLQLLFEENNPTLNLRVYITGGGCSGLQYGFTFDEKMQAGDILITTDGANLVIDPMSFLYLQGAIVDYRKGLEGSRFVVNNPNAKTTCGCGSSFTL